MIPSPAPVTFSFYQWENLKAKGDGLFKPSWAINNKQTLLSSAPPAVPQPSSIPNIHSHQVNSLL